MEMVNVFTVSRLCTCRPVCCTAVRSVTCIVAAARWHRASTLTVADETTRAQLWMVQSAALRGRWAPRVGLGASCATVSAEKTLT